MAITPSNLYINWSGVTFTPTSGSALPINKVTSCKPKRSGTKETFKGDLARFFQAMAVPTQERTVEVTTGDVKAAMAIPVGVPGTLVAVLADHLNGTAPGGGGFSVTLTNAVCTDNPAEGEHAKFASGTLTFEAFAPDGTTDPLTITPL